MSKKIIKKVELTADMIGGPADDLKLPAFPGTENSVSKATLMRSGYQDGYNQAVADYVEQDVSIGVLEEYRAERDVTDMYAVGFELGYLRKLAEILVA